MLKMSFKAVGIALCLLGGLSLAWAAEGRFDRTIKVTGPVDLEVETGSGQISIQAGAAGQVTVRGTIKANSWLGGNEAKVKQLEANPPIEVKGNIVRIGQIKEAGVFNNISISYEIVVPELSRLEAESGSGQIALTGLRGGPVSASTGSGAITAAEIGGKLEVETGSGSITVTDARGNLAASTGSGSVKAERVAGSAQVETGSGQIQLVGVTGAAKAHTGSGHVTLKLTGPGEVEAGTGSGGITIDGVKGPLKAEAGSGSIKVSGSPEGPWHLETGSGGVQLEITSGAGFNLDAESDSGRIDLGLPMTSLEHKSKESLKGKVRGGGQPVVVRSHSGGVSIR